MKYAVNIWDFVPFIIVLRFVTPVYTCEASDTFKMLRFLSRRKGRNVQKTSTQVAPGSQRLIPNKHLVPCRVILLDGTDLSIDLSVSIYSWSPSMEVVYDQYTQLSVCGTGGCLPTCNKLLHS